MAVHDANSTLPVVLDRDTRRLSGRGMQVVESYAAEWGVERDAAGKTVWCRVLSEMQAFERA